MQLVEQTLATTTNQIKELIQHCIVHNIEGPVNLSFKNNGEVEVWQPKNMPVAESVEVPQVTALSMAEIHQMD
jgi:hypothetical protein